MPGLDCSRDKLGAHVTSVTYAYNPVFKDRAGTQQTRRPVQCSCAPLRKRHLSAPCFGLRGRKPTLPSLLRQPHFSSSSSARTACRGVERERQPSALPRFRDFRNRLRRRSGFLLRRCLCRQLIYFFFRCFSSERRSFDRVPLVVSLPEGGVSSRGALSTPRGRDCQR